MQRAESPVSLSDAIAAAAAQAKDDFASNGLRNVKDICSGKSGGLGKPKAPRGLHRDAVGASVTGASPGKGQEVRPGQDGGGAAAAPTEPLAPTDGSHLAL
jgi:hypothetical protein